MTYKEALEYIKSFRLFGIKPGLERIGALCEGIGNVQDELKIVHVAGTNGKGSTSTMIANALSQADFKVGLFTSPYVLDFRERFVVDGQMIGKSELVSCLKQIKKVVEDLPEELLPTEFELITALAFLYFHKSKCDIVVLEVGLGGRYDSTNIIKKPLISLLTSISLDHSDVLGSTLEQIAYEKAGIIKEGVPLVSYPFQTPEVLDLIKDFANEKASKLSLPETIKLEICEEDISGSRFSYKRMELILPMLGRHMVYNAITAICALQLLDEFGYTVKDEHIKAALAKTKMPGRQEVEVDEPILIFDGGHNEESAQVLSDTIKKLLKGKRILALCCMMADKDYETYLKILTPRIDSFIATSIDLPRALPAEKLAEAASKYCKEVRSIKNAEKAFEASKALCGREDVLLVCGSFYFISQLKTFINLN
ncbi:MAG: bifunctional folylpolyglutamate synthase/dihydrofolate synthase [Clostridiales bacterium]|nr:bifunctional folylpolyglutamate synthase/dihydrofolate synthase [Clostridiales bacterium]